MIFWIYGLVSSNNDWSVAIVSSLHCVIVFISCAECPVAVTPFDDGLCTWKQSKRFV